MKPDSGRPSLPSRPVERKVFDVMRPGRAPANSTSKPVIVSHKPMVQDPSVTMNGVGERRPLMSSHQKITIQSETSQSQPTTSAASPISPAATNVSLPAAPVPQANDVASTSDPAPAFPTTPAPASVGNQTPSTPPAPVVAAGAAPVAPDTLPAELDDETLGDLSVPVIDTEEEVVLSTPVGPREFPWKTIVLVGVMVLFALAIVDILLDADFISWSVPHTHFLQ